MLLRIIVSDGTGGNVEALAAFETHWTRSIGWGERCPLWLFILLRLFQAFSGSVKMDGGGRELDCWGMG